MMPLIPCFGGVKFLNMKTVKLVQVLCFCIYYNFMCEAHTFYIGISSTFLCRYEFVQVCSEKFSFYKIHSYFLYFLCIE